MHRVATEALVELKNNLQENKPPGLALFGWVKFHGMEWTPGAAHNCLFPTSTPIPSPKTALRSGAFDCSWPSALPLVSRFALWGFHPPRFVCLSFGALGLLLARGRLSFFLFWRFCPLCCASIPVGGCGCFCPLMLVAAVGVPLLVPCVFCPPWRVFLLVVVSGV